MSTSRRRSAPKVRGGCNTCKSRHVRCDLQRPRCSSCLTSHRQCEYLAADASDQLRVVMWQPSNTVSHSPSSSPSLTNHEIRSFEFFRSKIATSLGGFFNSSFWTHDVLQVAQQEPAVQHAIVAVSSLSESMRRADPDFINSARLQDVFAIRQYTKAVSNLNNKLQASHQASPEVVLMTCALFICFEMLQNRPESALCQMWNGISVCYEWQSKARSSDYTDMRDSQLGQLFGRLMLQVMMFLESQPGDWKFMAPVYTPLVPRIPSAFQSVDEARDCLTNCLCTLHHESVSALLFPGEQSRISPSGLEPPHEINPLEQWSSAFDAFLTNSTAILPPREQQAASLLEILRTTGNILACAGPYSQESSFDLFEDSFSEIIALASPIIASMGRSSQRQGSSCPAFDMGILPPLYFVASRCRHPSIRRQALQLLRDGPTQEGIWHSGMLSSIAERIINIEEMGCSGALCSADIPANARLSLLNAKISSAERTVVLHCCRQLAGEMGEPVVFHESVRY